MDETRWKEIHDKCLDNAIALLNRTAATSVAAEVAAGSSQMMNCCAREIRDYVEVAMKIESWNPDMN